MRWRFCWCRCRTEGRGSGWSGGASEPTAFSYSLQPPNCRVLTADCAVRNRGWGKSCCRDRSRSSSGCRSKNGAWARVKNRHSHIMDSRLQIRDSRSKASRNRIPGKIRPKVGGRSRRRSWPLSCTKVCRKSWDRNRPKFWSGCKDWGGGRSEGLSEAKAGAWSGRSGRARSRLWCGTMGRGWCEDWSRGWSEGRASGKGSVWRRRWSRGRSGVKTRGCSGAKGSPSYRGDSENRPMQRSECRYQKSEFPEGEGLRTRRRGGSQKA